MSMNGAYRSVSARVIAALREDLSLVRGLTAPVFEPSPQIRAMPGMDEYLRALGAARAALTARFGDEPSAYGPIVGIDKAWHGVHFVLTGSAEPDGSVLGEAVLGGDAIGDDAGYGPAHLHEPAAVRKIAEAIAAFDDDALGRRYDADVMNDLGIYPEGWDEDGERLAYIADAVDVVRDVYTRAATAGHGLLCWLS